MSWFSDYIDSAVTNLFGSYHLKVGPEGRQEYKTPPEWYKKLQDDYVSPEIENEAYTKNITPPKQNRSLKDFIPKITNPISSLFEPGGVSWEASPEKKQADLEQTIQEFEKYGYTYDPSIGFSDISSQYASGQGQGTFQDYINAQAAAEVRQEDLDYILNTILPLSNPYGVPPSLIAGQWAGESGRDKETTNPFGLLFNGQLHDYQTLANAVRDYDLTIRDIASRNMGIPKEQFNYEDYQVEDILRALQYTDIAELQDPNFPGMGVAKTRYEGHSGDPLQYIDYIMSLPEYRYIY